jgi:hypothetical protein
MEDDVVANHILSLSPGQLPKRQLDSIVTVLLLLPSVPNRSLAYKGFGEGRYRLDPQLVVRLLRTANKEAQGAIVRSPAFWRLPTRVHRHQFFRFWRMRRRDVSWRRLLGDSLSVFLRENPGQGPVYANVIWTLARDSDESVALNGVKSTGPLGSALTVKQAKVLVELTAGLSQKAFAAKSQIGTLYKHFDDLRPEVKAFFLDRRTIDALRVNYDSTDTNKWGAHNWCLMHLRKVLRRSERSRTLRPVT